MFKNENPISENKQIEVGPEKKNQESMLRTSSKKREKKKKLKKRKIEKKKKRILNYTMSVGIFGQTSCEKKWY